MASIAIGYFVATAADRLSKVLIDESAVLIGVVKQVEWIERELRLMQAFLEHVERHGEEEDHGEEGGFEEWAEKLKDVARDAEDVIETFVIKSVKRKRQGPLYWLDRYKVGKELEKISKRIRDVAQRRMDIAIAVESPGESSSSSSSSTTTIVAPAVEKLDYILSQNLITRDEVIKIVEDAKDEIRDVQKIVSNLKSMGEMSEREKVWVEEAKEVCNNTVNVAGNFITKRERWYTKSRLEQVFFSPFERGIGYLFERKLKKEMKYVRTQIGDAAYRSVTYGVGGKDMGDKIGSRSRPVPSLPLKRLIIAKLPFVIYLILLPLVDIDSFVFMLVTFFFEVFVYGTEPRHEPKATKDKKISRVLDRFLFFSFIDFVIFFLNQINPVISIILEIGSLLYTILVWYVSLWRSMDRNLKSTQRDLALMRALFTDIQSVQGLNERQKVWHDQLRVVAQYGRSLITETPRGRGRFIGRIKFAKHINSLLNEILIVSERKTIYGIANVQGTTTRTGDNDDSNSRMQEEEHPAAASSYRLRRGLKEKVQSLRGEMQLMNALFRDVQDIGGELDKRSTVWLNQMRETAHETQSVLDQYAAKLEDKPIHVQILHYRARLVFKKRLRWIRNKIQDASRRRETFGLAQFQTRSADDSLPMVQALPRRRKQPSLVFKESGIVGLDDDAQVLMDQLFSDKEQRRCIISIVGIGGIGKKTLAHLIYDNSAVKNHFHCQIWMSVPPHCANEELIQHIAEEAAKQIMEGQPQDTWTTEVLEILASKRYLIVLEGVITSQLLDAFEKTIPDKLTASRLVLISRKASVEKRAGTRTFVHPMQLLDDQSSWMLFTAHLKVSIPEELKKLGEEIVIKCGGLPSEILKMSQLLSNKEVTHEEWSRVLEWLIRNQNPWNETLNTVNMNLPLYLRRCLFYFLLFPADYRIPARRLVVLWVAEGLVHQGEQEEPPEEVAERYLAELIDLNMVQIAKRKPSGKVKTCRIPNALRELWLEKANESRFFQVQGNSTDTASDPDAVSKISIIRRVADRLDKNDIWHDHIHNYNTSTSTSLGKYYKDVLSFLSFDAQEGNKPGQEIGNFLKSCISCSCFLQLRVLDLERVYKPRMPKSIARLSRLRYLGLRWTYLESLPSSISSLLKLQTLDLKHTYIHTLPISIWMMELRHLFLSETYRTRFPPQPNHSRFLPQPKGISHSLSDLQTLWGLFVDEETPVKGGLDRLVNVRKLRLACQSMSSQQEAMESQLEAVADWIMQLENLQSLMLKSRDEEGRPWNLHLKSLENHTYLTDMYLLGTLSSSSVLSQFPPSLVELTLSHSKLEDDPMQILKDLPNLRSLCLLAESYMGKVLVCKAQSFPQLQVLKLWMLEQLEEWIIELEALPCLRQLEIRSCLCLKMLPDGLKDVNSLLELKLTNIPMEFNTDEHNIPPNCQVFRDNSQ